MSRYEFSRREAIAVLGGVTFAGLMSGCTPTPEPQHLKPADKGPLHYATLKDVARMIEAREISPVELTQMMLDRIAEVDSHLNSYATVTGERALDAAHKAEQEISAGNYRGPMHGISVAVKDLCFTKGTRTMGGSGIYRDFVPEFDSTVVSRLEQAGAVLLGKLNLTEGAMAGYHPDFDVPVNPWGDELWSGASSSGSGVATAAGLCFASLGTDTGGSIRFPSMANGVVGLKPSYGRVSRYGVLPLAETLDHVGPMTRSSADAAIMLEAIAGNDANDPTSIREPAPNMLADLDAGISGLHIGFDRQYATNGTDPGLAASIELALEVLTSLGAKVVDVDMPASILEIQKFWFPICAFEAYRAHSATFPSRAEEYGPYFQDFLENGASVSNEQYAAASQQRIEFNTKFEAVLANVDAIVCPAGGLTFPFDASLYHGSSEALAPLFDAVQLQFTFPADFAGTPTLTVPCGFSDDSRPHALQFMGRRLNEPLLCRIGHAYEQATEWHERHPPV